MDEKILKKISRKIKRCEEILLKHENIRTSKLSTDTLFLGNGGLGCNIQYEFLVEVFSPYGKVERICMLPDKPYSFVIFTDTVDAEKAMNSTNGQKLKSGHIFYMSYVSRKDVPQVKLGENIWPSGLVLLDNFITEEEEENLIAAISFEDASNEKAILKHRKVKHYGYEFLYGSNNIDKDKRLDENIPDVCIPHLERLVALGYIPKIPDQLTVNHYVPGQGIPPHIDTHSAFEDEIISISLGSQVVMDFYCSGKEPVAVLLPRRSALIISGESRYLWKHGITPRKTDVIPCNAGDSNQLTISERSPRTSLTFRMIRHSECHCKYKDECDSYQKSKISSNDFVTNTEAEELEKKYVNQVYETIADHFSVTRYKPWPRVASFLSSIPPGSFILDVGCGNGKNMKLSTGCFEVGCDASSNLVQLCSKRNVEVLVADCLKLPFRDNCVDVVICIAVIHHMSTKARRRDAVHEIVRVLQPGGKGLIYVWAFEQEGPEGPSNYLKTNKAMIDKGESANEIQFSDVQLNNSNNLRLPLHENRTNFVKQDMLVPWKEKSAHETDAVHHRYYHVFAKGELETLVLESSGLIESSYYDKGNWCVCFRKNGK